jgi:tetratricopeptide (TPR) repeat protein
MLKKILKDKSNGELIVSGRNFTKNLYFLEGKLTFAKTTVIEERLGEILFKIGKIDKAQFLNINNLVKNQTDRLGKILVQKNILTQRDLFFALIYQVRIIATSTFELTSGEWYFLNQVPDIPEDTRLTIELPAIITEGTNKLASISYFKNKYYYKGLHMNSLDKSLKGVLSTHELHFYRELSKYGNKSCHEIMAAMNMGEDMFWKKMALFFLLNAIDFTEATVDEERDKNIEAIIRLFEQMKSDRMDYYQLLGIKHDAGESDIKNAYFQYAKKYHPDRISSAPDPEIKEKANFVFAEINKAYETLSNEDKKRKYDSKGYKDDMSADTIQENLAEKARILYRKGKVLYTQKQYWEAASILDEAVSLDSYKASYYLLLGMSQMNLPALRRRAADNLQKAIDLENWNIEAFTAMGILFMMEQQPKRAEGFFRKALSINPDHALARKKLEELTGKPEKKKKFSFFGKAKK